MSKILNRNLNRARLEKPDEYYTQLVDIENELKYYSNHFKNKIVYCNCDDPKISKFFHFFSFKFELLGLKELISVCYKNSNPDLFSKKEAERAIILRYHGDKNKNKVPDPEEIGIQKLNGDGDFRSQECIDILKKVDVIVTNPPFSLFRPYVAQLIENKKKFLIIGDQLNVLYKDIFKLIKQGKIWSGVNSGGTMWFEVPDHYKIDTPNRQKVVNGKKYHSKGSIVWFTNMNIKRRHEDLILYKKYEGNESYYPFYDNYDAIEVSKFSEIPMDFKGYMGVPVTFFNHHNPEQFEIIGCANSQGYDPEIVGIPQKVKGDGRANLHGKVKFGRIIIKNKRL